MATAVNQRQLEAIKWLSLACMVVDHVGLVLFPDLVELRWVGRLALPGFIWLLGHRLARSGAIAAWERLLLWTVPAEVAHVLMVGTGQPVNVLLALAGGAAALALVQGGNGWRVALLAATVLLAVWRAEYGLAVVVGVPLIALARSWTAAAPMLLVVAYGANVSAPSPSWALAALVGAAIVTLWPSCAGLPRLKPGWLFYAFYPAHQLALVALVLIYS